MSILLGDGRELSHGGALLDIRGANAWQPSDSAEPHLSLSLRGLAPDGQLDDGTAPALFLHIPIGQVEVGTLSLGDATITDDLHACAQQFTCPQLQAWAVDVESGAAVYPLGAAPGGQIEISAAGVTDDEALTLVGEEVSLSEPADASGALVCEDGLIHYVP